MKIGFGGGCHWCTEAVFQSLQGVETVEQGFIKSLPPHDSFSEAVLVTFAPEVIPLDILIDVHLRTHASTAPHKMRNKYRSAVYVIEDDMAQAVADKIMMEQANFEAPLVTLVLTFAGFKASEARFQKYYETDPDRPFCRTYIDPKLARIRRAFADYQQ